MLTTYAARGIKAGVVAGLAFGVFVALVVNPLVGFADELGHGTEQVEGASGGHHDEAGSTHEGSAVSTGVTHLVGVVSGVLWGVLLGGVVFGVAYYFLEPVIPGTGGTKRYLLAAAGFVTVSGAPWLVLPPQPPGVEQSLPTDTRILLYGGAMVVGAVACLLSGLCYDRLRDARGRATAGVVSLAPFALLAIPVALAPSNAVSGSVPDGLAAGLTGTIVFGQALLWFLLAGAHARLGAPSAETPTDEADPSPVDGAVTAD